MGKKACKGAFGQAQGRPYRHCMSIGEGSLWYTCEDDSDSLFAVCRDYIVYQAACAEGRDRPDSGCWGPVHRPPDRHRRAVDRARTGGGDCRRDAHPYGYALGLCGPDWRCLRPAVRQPAVSTGLQTDLSGCCARRSCLRLGLETGRGRAGIFLFPLRGESETLAGQGVSNLPIGLLIGLFMLMAVFSFIYGMSHSRPTTTIIRRFGEILLGIGLFFVVINTVRTQRELAWVTRWLFLAAWACASIAVVFYVIPENWTVRVLNALARFDYPGGFRRAALDRRRPGRHDAGDRNGGRPECIGGHDDPGGGDGRAAAHFAAAAIPTLADRTVLRDHCAGSLLDIQPFRPFWHGRSALRTRGAQVPASPAHWMCAGLDAVSPSANPGLCRPAVRGAGRARTLPHRCASASTRTP